MGLDITYGAKAKKIDCVFDASGEPIDPVTREEIGGRWYRACINPDFPGRADELDDDAIYEFDGEVGRFRAGSYGGYNVWRDELARLAGYPETRYRSDYSDRDELRYDAGAWEATEGPFWELINFADNEGDIGAAVSAKLAKDFADFQSKADSWGDEYWRERYANWRKAFETAADGGFVIFH